MAFSRNQYDTSYGSDFSQRSFKPQSGPTAIQHSLAPVTYPWQSIGGYQNTSSAQQSYGDSDYNYGYGDDYNKGNSNQNFNEGNFNQDYNKSNYDQDFNKGNYGQDFNKGNFGQDFNKGNYGQDFNKSNFGQDFNKGSYGQDFNKSNFGQDYNKSNFGQDYNKSNFGQDYNKSNFGQDYTKSNFGQDYNKSNFGQDYTKSNFGQDYNKSNFGQDFNKGTYSQDYNKGNFKQDYNEGSYKQNYNEGNFKQSFNENSYDQGFNEDNYSQDYNEDSFNQDSNAGYKYGDGFGNEWDGGETGSGIQWQGGTIGVGRGSTAGGGRGRGMGTGNVRGFSNTVRTGVSRGSFYKGGPAKSTFSMNEKVTNSSGNQGSFISNKGTGFSKGNSGLVRGGRAEGTRGRGGGSGKGVGREVPPQSATVTSVSLPPADAQNTKSQDANIQDAKSQNTVESTDAGQSTTLIDLIKQWQTFAEGFADCRNPISNMECSLKASKVNYLQLAYESNFLTKCSNYSVFTGVLHFKKQTDTSEESAFVARGYGMNKKTTKMDCYDKAYKLLMGSDVETITSQVDSGETVLRQELHLQFRQDPDSFVEYLKNGNRYDEYQTKGAGQPIKRRGSFNSRSGRFDAKRARMSDFTNEMIESKNLSLAPTKKIDLLMDPEDDLLDKLYSLKQLLREEGITRLHIVPKIDQFAHRVAIHIMNVYRFEDIPIYGFESRIPVYCEIYFDDVFMARGSAEFKRITATQKAYSNLGNLLCMRNLEQLADNPGTWHPYMAMDVDICDIVTKLHGRDNDSILTSNLTNMRQMMQSKPDVTIPIDRMVLTEHESDRGIENIFKSLELSATRNLMLLECEIVRNPDLTFTCTLSLQGRVLASSTHSTKNGAKRLSSEVIMAKMKRTHDIIYVNTEMVGRIITQNELLVSAAKKKALGEPPAKIFKKITEHKDESNLLTPDERRRQESDRKRFEEKENLPENVSARPLFPWIAAALYDILDEFYKKMTLEDLMLDIVDMPKSQREIVSACAAKMGLRMVTKTKTSFDGPILRRTVTAQDMCKMLQVHGGESGRYKLISCKKPMSKEELERFRQLCLEQHKKLVECRINDNPEADPEPMTLKMNQFSPGNIYERASTSKRGSKGFSRASYRGPRDLSGSEDRFFSGPPMQPGRKIIDGPPRPLMGSRFRPVSDSLTYGRRLYDTY